MTETVDVLKGILLIWIILLTIWITFISVKLYSHEQFAFKAFEGLIEAHLGGRK